MINLENNSELNTWLSWLESGGVYRSSNGVFYLYKLFENSDKNVENSIVYMTFYDSDPVLSKLKFFAKFNDSDFKLILSKLKKHLDFKEEQNDLHIPFSKLSNSDFEFSYKEITSKIYREEIEKAVPIVCINSDHNFSKTDLLKILTNLTSASNNLYPYGFWTKEFGIIGCTPEILFTKTENQLVSIALAGTLPKNQMQDRPSLLKDPKELREHEIVVQDIIDRFSKYGTPQVEKTKIVELPNLFHLATKISVTSNVEPIEIMKYLHPTGALGVIPRNFGLRWLKDLPFQSERGIFGAPIMFSHPDFGYNCLVAIRNLIWTERKLKIHAGCGLVKASIFENEFKELKAKIESIKSMLGINRL